MKGEQTTIELSCKESQLILRVIPKDKEYREMNEEETAAVDHYCSNQKKQYGGCLPCKEVGLSKILSKEISCQEAIETWAKKPGPFYHGNDVQTLTEILALEHIWGRKVPTTEKEREIVVMAVHDNIDNCKKKPCTALMSYWRGVPLSLFYDGEKEIAKQIPFTIELFKENELSLENILAIQKKRVGNMLVSLAKGEERFDHYHQRSHSTYELMKHIEVLQNLVK